ncbi:MAG: rRNA pseudouridine synthase, partial [Myxococcales bacterium]|nr:rRNA pseudouridine synthase [Myxococcales bacterium]
RVDGQVISVGPRSYLLLNKPVGVVCTMDDPEGRKIASDLLPKRYSKLFPVGRLDYSSEGALLMTNDGALANVLTHPKFGVEKVYLAKVRGLVQPNDPRIAQIVKGVQLEDGMANVERIHVTKQTEKNTWIEMILREGRNREIRRICEAVQLDLIRLLRKSFGPIELGGLQPGNWRELSDREVRTLRKLLDKQ